MEKFKITLVITILLIFSISCTKSKNNIKKEETNNFTEGKSGIEKNEDFASVKIDNNIWMSKNLNVDKLNNGENIIESKNIEDWVKNNTEKKPSFCYYNFNSKDSDKYGKIYNYYAIISNLAPKGWHIAKKTEWNELMNKYENSTSSLIRVENDSESNESGFSSFLCGYLVCDLGGGKDGVTYYPNFSDQSTAWWYSTSKSDVLKAALLDINSFRIQEYGENNNTNYDLLGSGFYIRCVKD
jgi:uncharacterized protein (TIGR02145 family)